MKTKFLLPVLAAIFAIGMSFTTTENESDPNQDYVLQNGTFMPLGKELNCGNGVKVCKVRLPDGNVYDVYNAADPSTLKKGIGTILTLDE